MRVLPILLLPPLALGLTACGSNGGGSGGDASKKCSYPKDGTTPARDVGTPPTDDLLAPKTFTLTLSYTKAGRTVAGDVAVDLATGTAPCAVNSLAFLAGKKYFDGTSCHRLTTAESGISVLQCGDPTGTGGGTPGFSFADELSGSETYTAGTVAMANAGADTNGSQFFLVYGDSQLAPNYTVLGHMRPAGTDVVKDIASVGTDTPGDGHPVAKVTIKSAVTAA